MESSGDRALQENIKRTVRRNRRIRCTRSLVSSGPAASPPCPSFDPSDANRSEAMATPSRLSRIPRIQAFSEQGVTLAYPARSWSGVREDDGAVVIGMREAEVHVCADGFRCLLWSPVIRGRHRVDRPADQGGAPRPLSPRLRLGRRRRADRLRHARRGGARLRALLARREGGRRILGVLGHAQRLRQRPDRAAARPGVRAAGNGAPRRLTRRPRQQKRPGRPGLFVSRPVRRRRYWSPSAPLSLSIAS